MSRSVFTFDTVPFEQRLAQAIAWCASRARASDPKLSLRSEELRPNLLERNRASMVESVANARTFPGRTAPDMATRESLSGGRLLVYFPDADLSDGAAEAASRGFFDTMNVPPWDTWIALADDGSRAQTRDYQQYVVAFVPKELVVCAGAGIAVNPEDCIAWLDESHARAREELRHLLSAKRPNE